MTYMSSSASSAVAMRQLSPEEARLMGLRVYHFWSRSKTRRLWAIDAIKVQDIHTSGHPEWYARSVYGSIAGELVLATYSIEPQYSIPQFFIINNGEA